MIVGMGHGQINHDFGLQAPPKPHPSNIYVTCMWKLSVPVSREVYTLYTQE
jgi:hypothetical protein